MTNIIKINKVIKDILLANDHLNHKVNGQVFSIVAPDLSQKITLPFITVQRNSMSTSNTKDYRFADRYCTVVIYIVDSNYERSVDITTDIINALENVHGTFDGITIDRITMTGGQEDYMQGAFVQNVTFKIEIQE